MDTASSLLRWGIVGLGNVAASRFTPALERSRHSRLVACVARSDAGLAYAAEHRVRHAHRHYDALVADPEVDAIYIATPNSLHCEQAIQALRAGKHVLCEKPLALDAAEGERVLEAAHRAGRVLRVAYQFRFDPLFERARQIVLAGELGPLRNLTLKACSPPIAAKAWRTDPAEGGILSDLGVHYLDLLPWMTGLPLRVTAAHAYPSDVAREPPQTVTLFGLLGDACHTLVRVTRELRHGDNSLSVEGLAGTLRCAAIRWVDRYRLTVKTESGERHEELDAGQPFDREIEAFEAAVAGRPNELADGRAGIAAIHAADAVLAHAGAPAHRT